MKVCPNCQTTYPDDELQCAYDGEMLVPAPSETPASSRSSASQGAQNQSYSPRPSNPGIVTPLPNEQQIPLVRRTFAGYRINGRIAEVNTQQYYPTTFAKCVRSLFSSEPFQFGHTSFATILRINEHQQMGIPVHMRDVTMYGNAQNILTTGDDVEAIASKKHGLFIARRVYNHTSASYIHVQGLVPAWIVKCIFLFLAFMIASLVSFLLQVNYAYLLEGVLAALYRLIEPFISIIIGIAIVVYLFRIIIKGGR